MHSGERFSHHEVEGLRVGRFGGRLNTTCILYRLGGTVIDTGPPNQWQSVRKFLQERSIHHVLLTHHHEDHSGNGARIHRDMQVPVLVHEQGIRPITQGFALRLYQKIVWGRPETFVPEAVPQNVSVEDNGLNLKMVHSPGHSQDMACYLEPQRGWLFSGDLFVASRPRYLRVDEDPNQQIESLEKLLKLDFETVFCSHRGILKDGRNALGRRRDYLVSLREKVFDLHSQGLPAHQIARRLLGKEDPTAWLTSKHFSKRNFVTAFLAAE